ncbi:HK97 family phage prohead protease [Sphingomonas sp. GC_Shp_3]|uniref:HK97 family phage prohead protease n=1 Tax=Sphingomonas sp. GC_Shp_3 TaxID=2937383 RepID=UPI00226A7487|nr:HK97 family phage prohead protease [Sphingomonas sp. GC_Shp_3]
MDRLSCDLEFKFDDETGKIDGYGSVFNLIDRGGDIVLPGAFKASLRAKGSAGVPMLWNHDASAPIGVWNDYAEDEKGLKLSGQLVLEVPQAAAVRALIKAKAIRGLSIGYRTQDYAIDRTTGARSLKKVDLWEVSVVTFPMLPEAQITGVKGAFDPRELERVLRSECNLSSAEAVKAVAIVKKHLRDGGDPLEQAARDGTKDLLMSLRKASTALS